MANDKPTSSTMLSTFSTARQAPAWLFSKSERPDFVSVHGESRAEVTRAVIKNGPRQEAAVGKHFGKDISDDMVRKNSHRVRTSAFESFDLTRDLSNGQFGDPLDSESNRPCHRAHRRQNETPAGSTAMRRYWLYLTARRCTSTRKLCKYRQTATDAAGKEVFESSSRSRQSVWLNAALRPREIALSGRVLRRIHWRAKGNR